MSVLEKIAFYQNRRDEVPNQQLAAQLAETQNTEGIKEIAAHLEDKNKSVQSDCLKVLYELGYLKPELIADYVGNFLDLLSSKNNRLVWGAMIALGTVADRKPDEIFARLSEVKSAVDAGSVITVVWGTRVLGNVAAANDNYKQTVFPLLIKEISQCIPRDVPLHAESILPAVDDSNKEEFLALLESRKPEMTPAQLARLKKVIKQL